MRHSRRTFSSRCSASNAAASKRGASFAQRPPRVPLAVAVLVPAEGALHLERGHVVEDQVEHVVGQSAEQHLSFFLWFFFVANTRADAAFPTALVRPTMSKRARPDVASDAIGVGDFLRSLNDLVRHAAPRVPVKGEVTSVHAHTSGHLYFTLGDAGGLVECAMWRAQTQAV